MERRLKRNVQKVLLKNSLRMLVKGKEMMKIAFESKHNQEEEEEVKDHYKGRAISLKLRESEENQQKVYDEQV